MASRSKVWIWGCSLTGITYLLTPWSRVLLEKLTGSAASQEFPRIFGTRRFLTLLTSARHLSLSWANSIQSPQPPPTFWRSILILSSYLRLGLPNGLLPSGFLTRTLCTPIPSLIRATCPAHLIILACWDYGFESSRGHGSVSLVSIMCCQRSLHWADRCPVESYWVWCVWVWSIPSRRSKASPLGLSSHEKKIICF